jgi:hypothetical protein
VLPFAVQVYNDVTKESTSIKEQLFSVLAGPVKETVLEMKKTAIDKVRVLKDVLNLNVAEVFDRGLKTIKNNMKI